jgi:transcriptional regulator with XRE-family HTH domain
MAQAGNGRVPPVTGRKKAKALPARAMTVAPPPEDTAHGNRDAAFGRAQLRAVGQRLRHLREARHWSLKELSLNSGVSVAAIHKIELGAANTGLSTVLALSEALGEPVDGVVRASVLDTQVVKVVHAPLPPRPAGDLGLTGHLKEALMQGSLVVMKREEERLFRPGSMVDPMLLFMLSGRLTIAFADGAAETLGAGDAMHLRLDAGESMVWTNRFAKPAQALLVTDPGKRPQAA